mmetsp:Transcript_68964/g.224798  ORF Transcript_68964/g.224798 Transcript_68964/m.224798 type:complete len:332 (+) Transcript_68964:1411-2406(+)
MLQSLERPRQRSFPWGLCGRSRAQVHGRTPGATTGDDLLRGLVAAAPALEAAGRLPHLRQDLGRPGQPLQLDVGQLRLGLQAVGSFQDLLQFRGVDVRAGERLVDPSPQGLGINRHLVELLLQHRTPGTRKGPEHLLGLLGRLPSRGRLLPGVVRLGRVGPLPLVEGGGADCARPLAAPGTPAVALEVRGAAHEVLHAWLRRRRTRGRPKQQRRILVSGGGPHGRGHGFQGGGGREGRGRGRVGSGRGGRAWHAARGVQPALLIREGRSAGRIGEACGTEGADVARLAARAADAAGRCSGGGVVGVQHAVVVHDRGPEGRRCHGCRHCRLC